MFYTALAIRNIYVSVLSLFVRT